MVYDEGKVKDIVTDELCLRVDSFVICRILKRLREEAVVKVIFR